MQEARAIRRVIKCSSPVNADVAQLVEQLIRNQQVIGSSPIVGSTFSPHKISNIQTGSQLLLPSGNVRVSPVSANAPVSVEIPTVPLDPCPKPNRRQPAKPSR